MSWKVIPHRAFDEWYDGLEGKEREHVRARVDFLAQNGPGARRPIVGKIEASRHANMKELVCPGDIRVLFAFDPESRAVLLVGGTKTDKWKTWYETNIPIADDRYDQWLKTHQPPKNQR